MNQESRPAPGQRYRHFKGNVYQIIALAYDSETNEEMVVYQALYGDFTIYVRSLHMFLEPVDKEKYPTAIQQYRFERIYPAACPERDVQETEICSGKLLSEKAQEEKCQEDKASSGDTGLNPLLIQFLDADTYADKLKIFLEMRDSIDEVVLTDVAASMDISTGTGSLEEQYASVQYALHTLAKYERNKR